jgi:hypothetical protein
MFGDRFSKPGSICDFFTDRPKYFAQSGIGSGPSQKIQGAKERHACSKQIGKLTEERGQSRTADATTQNTSHLDLIQTNRDQLPGLEIQENSLAGSRLNLSGDTLPVG